MAYEVTATRKRPQVFEKLVGQEFVVSTIENAIESGRIAHAYLFSGPRGVGKTSSARLLAKALNCKEGPTAHPCGVCDSCQEITKGSSVDVIEIDGASNTSVNDVRIIKDEVLFPPQASRYKIYIIDEVHMLSNSAFNALLKTIEEPPEYIIFIFATTELQKVPATIRSRCQQFHFQLIGLEDIKGCLKEACQEMNIKADEDALFWIAKEAAGSMRDAYTLFDQVASFSGDHITLQGIKDKLGLVGQDQIASIVTTSLSGNRKGALEELSSILSKGVSVEQCIRDFSDFFRSLLLAKSGVDSEEILNTRKEDLPSGILDALTDTQLEAALRAFLQTYREIRYSLSPRFELELIVSRLSSLPFLTSPQELVKKLEDMKADIAAGRATVVKEIQSAPPGTTVTKEAEPRPFECADSAMPEAEADVCTEEAQEEPVEEEPYSRDWNSFKDELVRLAEESGIFTLGNCMAEIRRIEEKDGSLTLVTGTSYSKRQLDENRQFVSQIIRDVTGFDGKVTVSLEEERKAEGNPLLERVAKAFRGQIVRQNPES